MNIIKIWILLLTISMLNGCSESPTEQGTENFEYPIYPNDSAYLNYQLSRFGLEELKNSGDVRFLWLRSAHDPIVFELSKSKNGRNYSAKVWQENEWKTYSEMEIKEEDDPFLKVLELEFTGFFEEPSFKKEDFRYTGGASWIFEARSQGKHHWIFKQSPSEDTHEGRWGRQLIEASINSPAVPIY